MNSYTYDETNRVKTQTVSKGNLTKTWTNEYSYETVSINLSLIHISSNGPNCS